MSPLQKRSPAPNAIGNRAEVIRNNDLLNITVIDAEANFAAIYLSLRFRISLPIARVVAGLALLGGVLA